MSDELPPQFEQAGKWPFTPAEMQAVRGAYDALARVGNATRDVGVNGPDTDGWDPGLDRAHHGLGLLLAGLAAEPGGPGAPGWADGLRIPDDLSGLLDGDDGTAVLPSQVGEQGSVQVIAGIGPLDRSPYITEVVASDDVTIGLPYDKAVAYGMAVLGVAHRAHYYAAVLAQARDILRGRNGRGGIGDGQELDATARLVLGALINDLPELDDSATAPLRFTPAINRAGEPVVRGSLPPHTEPFTVWTFPEACGHATAVLAQAHVSHLDTAYRTVISTIFDAGEQRGRAAVADLGNYYQHNPVPDPDPDPGAGAGRRIAEQLDAWVSRVAPPAPGARPQGGKAKRRRRRG